MQAVIQKGPCEANATLACLPHTFAAEVPKEQAQALKNAVKQAVEAEWKQIAEAVKGKLSDEMKPYLTNWDQQVETFFEITVVVRPAGVTPPDSQGWVEDEWNKLTELLEMTRSMP